MSRRLERHAVVVHPDVPRLVLQREHLEPAGVREHRTGPPDETVEATEALDHVGAGLQHQVVRVAENDAHAEPFEVDRVERAHRTAGADDHEARRRELAVRGGRSPGASEAFGRLDGEADRGGHHVWRSSSMQSPKERNR